MASVPVLIAAGAGQALSGFFGSKGASRAAKAQQQSQMQALAYQRERDRIADQRYTQKWDDYTKRYATWEDLVRQQLGAGGGSSGGGGSAAPVTLGDLAGASTSPAAAPATGGSLADMASGAGDWTDWQRYYPRGL